MKANEKVQVKVLKRRIEQLLNGIFEYETPKLQISEDKIEAKVREGKQVRGSFSLENPAQKMRRAPELPLSRRLFLPSARR